MLIQDLYPAVLSQDSPFFSARALLPLLRGHCAPENDGPCIQRGNHLLALGRWEWAPACRHRPPVRPLARVRLRVVPDSGTFRVA